jgi:hypothetical protein
MMLEEGLFPRLLDLVREKRDEDRMLWNAALDLMYEMSRIQQLRRQDLGESNSSMRALVWPLTFCPEAVNDAFITYLLQLVEEDPDDPNDPYHYPIIRVLVGGFPNRFPRG